MQAVETDGEWTTHSVTDRRAGRHPQRAGHLPAHGRRGLDLRRPGDPVRHDHQRLAHVREHGSDLRVQPVLRVHVPQRHRLQPGEPQPHEVRRRGRRVRRRGVPLRGAADPHGAGDPRRQRVLPDAADRGELAQVPAARPGLREPRRPAHVTRPRVRLGRRAATSRPALTAIMHGEAYRQSVGDRSRPRRPVPRVRRQPQLRSSASSASTATRPTTSPRTGVPTGRARGRPKVFDEALELGKENGYRNAQVTVLAPTGTIAFMMDCDTTGIEPDIALIKYKKLVGEGFLKIVNQTVPAALRKLGYSAGRAQAILDHINDQETIEGAPGLKPEHLPVFDCAFKPVNGERSIHYMGHVRMMSAVQPFISGAISKTVNMPEAATAEEIEQVYLEGWKLGLKAIAIYRDGSKRSQPLSHRQEEGRGLGRAAGAHRRSCRSSSPTRHGRGGQAAPPPAPGRADRGHPQVRHRRPRGLHHRRAVPRRPARRDLPEDGQGRLDRLRPHGLVRHDGLRRAPVRRPAPRPGQQVRARPVRAQRVHRQLGDPDRQVARRLHLPVAGRRGS